MAHKSRPKTAKSAHKPKQVPETTSGLGILCINVDNDWSVQAFGRFLSVSDLTYKRISILLSFSERAKLGTLPPDGMDYIEQELELGAAWSSDELSIKRININSPGLLELFGHLNPIKVISEFITKWRHENTIRERDRSKAKLEQVKLQVSGLQTVAKVIGDAPTEYRDFLMNKFAEVLTPVARIADEPRLIAIGLGPGEEEFQQEYAETGKKVPALRSQAPASRRASRKRRMTAIIRAI